MENKKSNTGLIVTIVVLVMLLLFGGTLLVLSSMGYLSFGKNDVKEEEKVDKDNVGENQENEVDNDNVGENQENEVDNDKRYISVIEDYRKYINDLSYDSENINSSDSYIISNNDFNIGYSYYDLDNNGIDELLISSIDNDGNFNSIIDVYTFNENNTVKVLDKSGVCQRCSIEVWDNGMIFYRGSGGASRGYLYFYRVSLDANEYVDRYMYEYDESNYSVYKINSNGTKISDKLNYSSDKEIISYYKKDASALSLDAIKWNEIK